MRTIKFRAQDIASNKWLYGDIRHHKNDVCIFEQGENKGELVKPETVGQFTGLHDVDGNEIYEGDRVFFNDPLNDERSEATVYWNETFLRFMLYTGVGDYDLTDSEELQLKINKAPRIMVNVNTKQP